MTFIDLVGFNDGFTQKIMNGDLSMSIQSDMSEDMVIEENIHLDLFSLRNLVLSADQAQSHGYRLRDVSLCEERVLANIISHRFKTDHSFNLLGFVNNEDESFQESLNSLEFCLKFLQTFNTKREYMSIHSESEEAELSRES